MRRTFRIAPQRRFSFLFLLVLLVAIPSFGSKATVEVPTAVAAGMLALLVVWISYIALDQFVTRVVCDEEGISSFDLINRVRFRVEYSALTGYRPDELGNWSLFREDARLALPRIEFSEFHSVIAEYAPRALNAKPWHCGQVPPREDFEGLGMFDFETWIVAAISIALMGGILSFLGPGFVIGYCLYPVCQRLYALKDVVGRLAFRADGMEARWLLSTRSIRWDEISAVFCERRGRRRRFVVTSGSTAIVIPRHVALELEVMRKFLYSLPDGTRCVNFGPDINRGYRVRRRKTIGQLDLGGFEPAGAPM